MMTELPLPNCFLPAGCFAALHSYAGRSTQRLGGRGGPPGNSELSTAPQSTAVWRGRPEFQAEFAPRMDRCVADDFEKANHSPAALLNDSAGSSITSLAAGPGTLLRLIAKGSSDPDSDTLKERWWHDREAGMYPGHVKINAADTFVATIAVPADASGTIIHVVLERSDSGLPSLTRYRCSVISAQSRPPSTNAQLETS